MANYRNSSLTFDKAKNESLCGAASKLFCCYSNEMPVNCGIHPSEKNAHAACYWARIAETRGPLGMCGGPRSMASANGEVRPEQPWLGAMVTVKYQKVCNC